MYSRNERAACRDIRVPALLNARDGPCMAPRIDILGLPETENPPGVSRPGGQGCTVVGREIVTSYASPMI
jgi:hypothetical protein